MSYLFDNKNFSDNIELAHYLSSNFSSCLTSIYDRTLYDAIEMGDPILYEYLVNITREYGEASNILTMTIYALNKKEGVCTPNFQFKDQYEIASVMKSKYPNIVPDIENLFKDKVLVQIFWSLYSDTQDAQYKRYYTFMLHIYENRMYEFTYYYFLFLHLSANDNVKFSLDGVKMTSVEEISRYIVSNSGRVTAILEEIMHSPFILALIAKEVGIDQVAYAISQGNCFAILKPLSLEDKYNFISIIKNSMAFWLIENYTNYRYESKEAKELFKEYKTYTEGSLNNISDYLREYKHANELYKKFKGMFVFDRLVRYQKPGISAKEEKYYLSCIYDNEYVSEKFLIDSKLYKPLEHNEEYQDTVEREHLIKVLDNEAYEYRSSSQQVSYESINYSFNTKKYALWMTESIFFILFSGFSFVYGLILVGGIDNFTLPTYISSSLALLGLVWSFVTFLVYLGKTVRYKRMKRTVGYFNNRVDDIQMEIEDIRAGLSDSSCFDTLSNLEHYQKERQTRQDKSIKLIKNHKEIPDAVPALNSIFAGMGIVTNVSLFILNLLELTPISLEVIGVTISFYIFAIINLFLNIIFGKKLRYRVLIFIVLIIIEIIICFLI